MRGPLFSSEFLRTMVLFHACVLTVGCERTPPTVPELPVTEPPILDQDVATAPEVVDPTELLPGSISAFGLILPAGSTEDFAAENRKIYSVSAEMSRVMRYLKRRLVLDTSQGEIHPMAVMLEGVYVRDSRGRSTGDKLDLGVRDEGERTRVTFFRHADRPVVPTHTAESLRAAGFDPQGRPLPANNY